LANLATVISDYHYDPTTAFLVGTLILLRVSPHSQVLLTRLLLLVGDNNRAIMSKRKGMSLEEKRKTILAIYHESKDVMNLKEIESLASKRGVVLQR